MTKEVTTVDKAFEMLYTGLQAHTSTQIGSFGDFLRDVWSQGFDHPEYFNAWHIGVVADDIEQCLEDGKNLCSCITQIPF